MNYITSCPACDTQFLLNKEHLKAHRGKVQCGNCEHIFNAKNRLTEIADDSASVAEYQSSLEVKADDVTEIANEKPIGDVLNNVLESVPNLEDLNTTELNSSEEFQYTKPSNTHQHAPEAIDAYAFNQTLAPITINDLTAGPKYQKTKLNLWGVLFCLLLAILAGLQTIYATRAKIAAEYPQFKPYLAQACVLLKCKINLPKNLDAFAIDDADMQEDDLYQNVIKFSSLLINNAAYVQAYPNIELTLTDTANVPVLRRIIKPSEYLKANIHESSGIDAGEEVRINLAINVTDLAVAGYRALLVH